MITDETVKQLSFPSIHVNLLVNCIAECDKIRFTPIIHSGGSTPINLLSASLKIFERILMDHIESALTNINLDKSKKN